MCKYDYTEVCIIILFNIIVVIHYTPVHWFLLQFIDKVII